MFGNKARKLGTLGKLGGLGVLGTLRLRVLMTLTWWRYFRLPLGHLGERQAANYLRCQGYYLLFRNLKLPAGEIDLVVWSPQENQVVLVEVKSRLKPRHELPSMMAGNLAAQEPANASDHLPEKRVGSEKRKKLHHLMRQFKQIKSSELRQIDLGTGSGSSRRSSMGSSRDAGIRMDIMGVDLNGPRAHFRHYENVTL